MNLLLTKLTAQILINRGTCNSLYITHKTPWWENICWECHETGWWE